MNYKVLVAATLVATVVQAATVDENLPQPWFKNGQPAASERCLAGVDPDMERRGTPNITLKCETQESGFVGVMQSFNAEKYRNTRIRLSGLIKADAVEGWGGLWMRVDEGTQSVAFDNMQNRAVKGTADWTPYEVVLDVSADATGIFFGTLMSGKGQIWLGNLQFGVVDDTVASTDMRGGSMSRTEPGNLELAR